MAALFPQYLQIGRGCGNLLAYGVFDLDAAGTNKLLARGRYTDGSIQPVNVSAITEDVSHSWYTSPSGLNPASGQTEPDADKAGAYSWIKSPRYNGKVHEVGPLARMWVNGDYRNGISVIDRLAARAWETKKVADAMSGWLNNDLISGGSSFSYKKTPASASGIGLTEAPRGALGHWVDISTSKISRYQVITPTAWNASPMDDKGQNGPIEQALLTTPVADINQPIEVLRVIHSFDPCLACSVHMLRPDTNKPIKIVDVLSGL
jgi:hydrogenase large subunit